MEDFIRETTFFTDREEYKTVSFRVVRLVFIKLVTLSRTFLFAFVLVVFLLFFICYHYL